MKNIEVSNEKDIKLEVRNTFIEVRIGCKYFLNKCWSLPVFGANLTMIGMHGGKKEIETMPWIYVYIRRVHIWWYYVTTRQTLKSFRVAIYQDEEREENEWNKEKKKIKKRGKKSRVKVVEKNQVS